MANKKYAVFTMDVETFADTECIQNLGMPMELDLMDGFDEYIRILDQHNIHSTLFALGDLAAPVTDKLRACVKNGHDLALHGYHHVTPLTLPPEQFREQLRLARERLKELCGVEASGFRAPCFSMDNARLDVLRELGFRYDSSYLNFPSARHTVQMDLQDYEPLRPGMFRKNGFYEFGLSKSRVMGADFPVSGGGYVRLGPWFFAKPLLRQYVCSHDFYVFYLHPFELTRKKIPFIKGLKGYDQYYIRRGIRKYGKRIEQLIRMLQKQGFEFVTFAQLAQIMEEKQPIGL